MKNKFLIKCILLFIFLPLISDAQFFLSLEDRSKCNLSESENERFEKLSAINTSVKTDLVSFGTLSEITNQGRLTLQIPNSNQCILAKVIEIEYQDEDNYGWAGTLEDGDGHVVLVKEQGYLGGSIRTKEGKYYTIHPLTTEESVLIEDDVSFFPPTSTTTNSNNSESDDVEVLCDEDNLECTETVQEIKIMFLIPDDLAEQFDLFPNTVGYDIYARIVIYISDIAFKASGINNVSLSWITRRVAFEYSFGPPVMAFDIGKLRNNDAINDLRDMEKADLVVMFTDRGYEDAAGIVSQIGPDKDDAFSIVEINAIPNYTFTHELGHLLGARHERGNDDTEICCHGFHLGGSTTIMHTSQANRILRFTNAEQGIGNAENNNALCIQNAACVISTFYERQKLFSADFTSDPDCVGGDDNGDEAILDFTAEVCEPPFGFPGQPPYQYVWRYSTQCCDNAFTLLGSGEQIQFNTTLVNDQPFYMKLIVTGSDNVVTEERKLIDVCIPSPEPSTCDCDNLTASFEPSLPNCPSGTNGSLTVTPEGGTAPYTYAWSTNDNTATVDNLAADTYTVTVTDANNCSDVFSYDLQGASPLDLRPNIRDTDCGASNGNIRLRPQGAPGPYSYQWSNSSTSKNQFGLAEGNYTVTVTDGNGCIVIGDYEIKQRNAPELDLDITNTNCNEDNGAIDLTITGGTAPYTIQWDNDCGPEDEEDIFDLAAGTYSVTVTDDRGCVVTASGVVEKSSRIRIVARTTEAAVGQSDGDIDLSVKGGTPPYEYDWDTDGTGDFDDPEDLTGLTAGTYTVVVRDATGCTIEEVVTIRNPKSNDFSLETEVTDASCGADNGAIDLTISGGTAPYTIDWDNDGTGDNDDPEDLTDLAAGDYNVTVTDANGASTTASATVGSASGLDLSTTSTAANCGADNGTIDLTISGGQAPYTIDWDNDGTGDNDDPEDLTDLAAGDYNVTVTDANGCSASTSASVGSSGGLTLSAIPTNASCGANNGAIDLTVSGGQAPYTIDWDNDGTGDNDDPEDLTDLAAGSYNVTVTDANACSASATATVEASGGLTITPTLTPPSACNITDGSISIAISGGASPYQIDWLNAEGIDNLSIISDLLPGIYEVIVTDANGCSTMEAFELTHPSSDLRASFGAIGTDCMGNGGGITFNAIGGIPPYTYFWKIKSAGPPWPSFGPTFDISYTATNIPQGLYDLFIADANSCTYAGGVEIGYADDLLKIQQVNPTLPACGASDGALEVVTIQGTPPMTYELTNNGTINRNVSSSADAYTFTNLPADSYDLTVTDSDGCVRSTTFNLVDDSDLAISLFPTNAICENNDGSVNLVITGGIEPYQIDWGHLAGNNNMEDLPMVTAGTYEVTVTDADNCSRAGSVEVDATDNLQANFYDRTANCNGVGGGIDFEVVSGTPPYTYSWRLSPSGAWQSSPAISDPNYSITLSAGTYNVEVRDANGCEEFQTVTVEQQSGPSISYGSVDYNCSSGGGTINTNVSGGTSPYTYSWENIDTGNGAGTSPNLTVTGINGNYRYKVTVTDADGCSDTPSNGKRLYEKMTADPRCFTTGTSDVYDVRNGKNGGSSNVDFTWTLNGSFYSSAGFFMTQAGETGNFALTINDNTTGCSASGSVNVPTDCGASATENETFHTAAPRNYELKVFPNPFNGRVKIHIVSAEKQQIEIRLYDQLGRMLYRQYQTIELGINKFFIDLAAQNALSDGVHQLLILSEDGEHEVRKLLRQH